MQDFFAGIVVGVIALQTAVFAPTIFTTIESGPAGTLLRALFPKFFRLLAVLGVATLVALWFSSESGAWQYVLAGLTVVLSVVCAAMIPATNRATDQGNSGRFKLMHTLSVVLTLVMLLSNIAIPIV
ncbi:MAG: DUF4149 domain-containing protein [Planctomycetota bacterium]